MSTKQVNLFKQIPIDIRAEMKPFGNDFDFIAHVKSKYGLDISLSKDANNVNGEKFIIFQGEQLIQICDNRMDAFVVQ